jgi:hypothetical protein
MIQQFKLLLMMLLTIFCLTSCQQNINHSLKNKESSIVRLKNELKEACGKDWRITIDEKNNLRIESTKKMPMTFIPPSSGPLEEDDLEDRKYELQFQLASPISQDEFDSLYNEKQKRIKNLQTKIKELEVSSDAKSVLRPRNDQETKLVKNLREEYWDPDPLPAYYSDDYSIHELPKLVMDEYWAPLNVSDLNKIEALDRSINNVFTKYTIPQEYKR